MEKVTFQTNMAKCSVYFPEQATLTSHYIPIEGASRKIDIPSSFSSSAGKISNLMPKVIFLKSVICHVH